MAEIIGIETPFGILMGRDAIYLDSISHVSETEIILKGEFYIHLEFKKYEILFHGIQYLQGVELDFDERGAMVSFGIINNSKLLESFRAMDHSEKLNASHQHYYFRTYDTVFEIIADAYQLNI